MSVPQGDERRKLIEILRKSWYGVDELRDVSHQLADALEALTRVEEERDQARDDYGVAQHAREHLRSELFAAGKRLAALESWAREAGEALSWYKEHAEATARYLAKGKETNADALMAIITTLGLDAGRKGNAVLARKPEGV